MRAAILACLLCSSPLLGQDSDKAKALRSEIAELRAKLVKLEIELLSLDDKVAKPKYISPVKTEGGLSYSLNVGDVGTFGTYSYKVEEVLDDAKGVRLSVGNGRFHFVVKGADVTNLADGVFVKMPGVWAVTGTVRDIGRTLFLVEPRHSGKLVRAE